MVDDIRNNTSFAIFGCVALFSWLSDAYAQSDRLISQSALAEKIYLQTDADVYTTDQTIWFSAVVAESMELRPSALSGVLHVELIAPDERVVDRKRIKLTAGTGAGSFPLTGQYTSGTYLIRAYTEWNKNFGSDFIAQTYVKVFPTAMEIERSPITALQLNEKEPTRYWLYAQLNPQLIDENHKKELTVFLAIDGQKDTLALRGTRGGYYLLDYPLPIGASLATILMETQNGIRSTRTVSLKRDSLDVQFFAESGRLIQGIRSKVGVRVRNHVGRSVGVSGVIMDSRGDTVTLFKTNRLGIGSFTLTADRSRSYYAMLDSASKGTPVGRYPLPEVSDTGVVLSVEKVDTAIRLSVYTNGLPADTATIQVSCRGVLYYLVNGLPKDGYMATDLPIAGLPEGIIDFTLLDAQMRPIAERLYVNQQPDSRLNIELSMDKKAYQKRDKAILSMKVSDKDGLPVDARLSVRIMNKDQLGSARTGRQGILSRLLLDSELQGEVDEPGYYFQPGTPLEELDALMLVQGPQRYHYNEPLQDSIVFANEPQPYVSGRVGGVLSKKAQSGVSITLLTFGETRGMDVQQTDSLGRFAFGLGEEYVDSLAILLQSTNKSGKNRNYTISLDERRPPPIHFNQQKLIEQVDTVVSYVAKKRQERAKQELSHKLASGEILLDEVEVVRNALSPQQRRVQDRFGEPDVVIPGKAIQDKEAKWSYGLYSVLLFNFPDELRIERVGENGGYLRANIIGGETTLVVVDGIPVPGHSYGVIPNIPPSEVKSVELIRYAKDFSRLYQEVYPEASPMSIPAVGSVISIYTHAGNGVYAARKPVGLLQAIVPVYSPVIEFQAPSYEKPTEEDKSRPDLRTLIHWAPQLATGQGGESSTSYYNSDVPGETVVIVEAIATNGRIGYQELVYEVTD